MAGYTRSTRYPELFRPAASSKWWAFIPNPAGGRALRESTGHVDDRAAHAWYLDRVRRPVAAPAKGAGATGAPADGREETTLHDALVRRRRERQAAGRAAGTLEMLEKKGKVLERILGADRLLSSLTARLIDQYVALRMTERGARKGTTVDRPTIHKELVTLRGAMLLARRHNYACPLPEEVMPLDFSGESKPRKRALSLVEIEKVAAALQPKRRAVFLFILATGATYPSEVRGMVPDEDVDLKAWRVHLRGTKRHTRDRVVPVVSFARKWLREAVRHLPFDPWTNVRRDLHAACKAAKVPVCSPNDLRRSIATLMRARGVEPSLLAAYLGHKDSRMAERVYGRLAPEQLQRLLEQRLAATAGSAGPARRASGDSRMTVGRRRSKNSGKNASS